MCSDPLSRFSSGATRVASRFPHVVFMYTSGITLQSPFRVGAPLASQLPGYRIARQAASQKSCAKRVQQLHLRVSRFTVQQLCLFSRCCSTCSLPPLGQKTISLCTGSPSGWGSTIMPPENRLDATKLPRIWRTKAASKKSRFRLQFQNKKGQLLFSATLLVCMELRRKKPCIEARHSRSQKLTLDWNPARALVAGPFQTSTP